MILNIDQSQIYSCGKGKLWICQIFVKSRQQHEPIVFRYETILRETRLPYRKFLIPIIRCDRQYLFSVVVICARDNNSINRKNPFWSYCSFLFADFDSLILNRWFSRDTNFLLLGNKYCMSSITRTCQQVPLRARSIAVSWCSTKYA